MTSETIYRGVSPAAQMAAVMRSLREDEERAKERWRAQWRYCPRRAGPLGALCDQAQKECRGHCVEMRARGLRDDWQPMARKHLPRCGAKTRAGGECKVKVEPGKLRCRFHGGKSTGPRTEEGRARIAAAQRERWARWREARDDASEVV